MESDNTETQRAIDSVTLPEGVSWYTVYPQVMAPTHLFPIYSREGVATTDTMAILINGGGRCLILNFGAADSVEQVIEKIANGLSNLLDSNDPQWTT